MDLPTATNPRAKNGRFVSWEGSSAFCTSYEQSKCDPSPDLWSQGLPHLPGAASRSDQDSIKPKHVLCAGPLPPRETASNSARLHCIKVTPSQSRGLLGNWAVLQASSDAGFVPYCSGLGRVIGPQCTSVSMCKARTALETWKDLSVNAHQCQLGTMLLKVSKVPGDTLR